MIELDTNTPLIERKIRRCENLTDRTRHCSDERHSLCEKFIFKNKDGYFQGDKGIGWLANQWYTKKDRGPTKHELKLGLIHEAERDASELWSHEAEDNQRDAVETVMAVWHILLLSTAISRGDKKQLIDLDVLMNWPEHQLVKHLLYLYSMDTFIAKGIRESIEKQDLSKVNTLGPFAYCLQCIIDTCNMKKANKLSDHGITI